ncbi:MAG: hypothetical protein LBR36_01835 [Bacteroidales bacterium]|jgi:peptidoglycan hydrolase CwlO-like protein|nr:hypothetical protein [Bacteroidales bacterium]
MKKNILGAFVIGCTMIISCQKNCKCTETLTQTCYDADSNLVSNTATTTSADLAKDCKDLNMSYTETTQEISTTYKTVCQ